MTTSIPYASLFVAAGKKYGIDPALLAAVAKQESQFNPNALNPNSGASGLMQLMPEVAAHYGVNPFDPSQAVDAAARILKQDLQQFGSVKLAAAAYNAGPGNVQKYGGVPPFPETQGYVQKVVQYQSEYEGQIGTGGLWQNPLVKAGAIVVGALALGSTIFYVQHGRLPARRDLGL